MVDKWFFYHDPKALSARLDENKNNFLELF